MEVLNMAEANPTTPPNTNPQKRVSVKDVRLTKGTGGEVNVQVRAVERQTGKPARKSRKNVNPAGVKQAVLDLIAELEA
jgi:hypothetical protein